jgi:hypothetical protein
MRQYYPSPDILTDHIVIVKILITAAKLYNLSHIYPPKHPNIKDTLATLNFYIDIITHRYNIPPTPHSRHDEYNRYFQVAQLLKPSDIAALTLQKAIRLHSIYHEAHIIHDDTAADIKEYLNLFTATGVPDRRPTHTGNERPSGGRC